jgi:hypothetical protein
VKYALFVFVSLLASGSFAQTVDTKFVSDGPNRDYLYNKLSGEAGSNAEKIYNELAVNESRVSASEELTDFDFDYVKSKSADGLYCTKTQKSGFVLTLFHGLTVVSKITYDCLIRVSIDSTGAHLN